MKGVFAAAFLNRYGQNFHPFLNGSSFIWRVFWRVLSKGNSAMLLISTRQRASQKLWLGQASWIHHSVSEAPELWKPQLWCCWRRECSHGSTLESLEQSLLHYEKYQCTRMYSLTSSCQSVWKWMRQLYFCQDLNCFDSELAYGSLPSLSQRFDTSD